MNRYYNTEMFFHIYRALLTSKLKILLPINILQNLQDWKTDKIYHFVKLY